MESAAFETYQPEPILHDALPDEILHMVERKRLPGIAPVEVDNWLVRDAVFAQQMALRDKLIATNRSATIIAASPVSDSAIELLGFVLRSLGSDDAYTISGDNIRRPDGQHIDLGADTPVATLGRLVQEDLLLLEAGPSGHVLTEGALCFPSSWTFSEKAGRPLGRIHVPVESYDTDIEKRVQRLFDAIRPGQILARANLLAHDYFQLFQPHSETDPRDAGSNPQYQRAERQCILRLPQTGAMVFSIHTYVVARNLAGQP